MHGTVVSNSSPLIHLAKIGKLDLLHELFGDVWIPPAVYEECVVEGKARPEVVSIKHAAWLRVTPVTDQNLVKLLYSEIDRTAASTEVPLYLYPNIYTSGSVPKDWKSIKGGSIKYPVRNPMVRRYLQQMLAGKWQKVIKKGSNGEVHYFEHASGQVAGVKFFPDQGTP